MKTPPDLLDQIAAAAPLAGKLAQVRDGEAVSFEHVFGAAQPSLAAVLARGAKHRVWLVCADVRTQETFHNELLQWFPEALFFPEVERAPVEGALPDPETAAERLGIVQKLTSGKGRQIVVLTRASLESEVPTAATLKQLEITLKRTKRLDREALLKELADAGYEHMPQVSARGQYAVRGGILDIFSFHHSLPVRVELFDDEIESIREFDLDSQISVSHLDACTLLLGEAAAEKTNCRLRELIADRDLTIDADASWFAARVRIVEHSEGVADGDGTVDDLTTDDTDDTDGEKSPPPIQTKPTRELTTDDTDDTDGEKSPPPIQTKPTRELTTDDTDDTDGEKSPPPIQTKPTRELTTDHPDHTDRQKRPDPDSSSVPSVLSVVSKSASSPVPGSVESAVEDFATAFFDHGLGEFEAGDFVVDAVKRERFFAQLREWREGGWRVHVVCNNEGEIERLNDLIPPVEADPITFTIGTLAGGFTFPAARLAVLSDAELFGRYRNTRARRIALRRARDQASRAQIDFSELNEDDHVVHLEHGIGRYEGTKSIPRADGKNEEVLVVAFADDARMYVPLEQSFLISRYVGVGKRNPPLSTLGDGKWAKAKKNAEKAVFDYASKLLAVHAERETAVGHAFPPDNKWQHEFEASFLYKETPDQMSAIVASKTDMESERPMDRLICGDVGFGKTEVAIRTAFKAVMGGKQVAILVPTTVLAEQHYRNFRERMSDYPVTVELLSRFRSPAEQRKTVEGLKDGRVDIVVGTHRLISKDIAFKNLGLVVIDEEQRFGVLHKEKFKEMFQLVDMLTLSATPIPRTLYLSLMGAKDMSTIETPPLNRIPTETLICPYDERIIRDAINREMSRQGQVYFLHNRVGSIEGMRDKIKKLCPKARCLIGHGQMDEHELEDVMHQFVSGAADVLISTTIIESGLDIPNANTIIIDRADRFGLADLYQLRGRVGRAQHKAYAYLLLPRDMMSGGEARRRINAIKQYSSLGAGFKIAMRDLEIRGAGNILGTQQSGHIVNIGFDLYCALLKQAISKLKGEKVRPRLEVIVRTDFVATREAEYLKNPDTCAPAFLPSAYIAESQPRIQAYRRLAEVTAQEALDALRKTWRDRFGVLPEAVENLLVMTEIKLAAAARKMTIVEVREDKAMLTRNDQLIQIEGRFPRLTAREPAAKLREFLALIRAF